ncbi:hypothetical protein TGPRC2_244930 [Toxoplasma gondii TgCatPRC2]|uniref:Uncharacterized protein n=4 Tax=Toxoplasma gondii TaxID=5811 RepID=A0A151GZ63_TOXGO|nr:hypothetical protein TGPRC2_244930 [Toxoplasma gondii TgCatPRC2]
MVIRRSNSLTARITGNRGARPEGNGSTQHLMQMTGRRAARESFLAPNNCTTSSRVSRAKASVKQAKLGWRRITLRHSSLERRLMRAAWPVLEPDAAAGVESVL